ncbi:MAG: hypothetical protein RBT44_11420, partial [Sphaerochaetaceae bacterium]|nr:hypothetical protein [Sphaerochaetaceae bacterium]
MRKLTVLFVVLCLLVPTLLFSAGGKEAKDDQITIAFCFQDLETEFWVAGHKAITETLRENGIKVIEKNA